MKIQSSNRKGWPYRIMAVAAIAGAVSLAGCAKQEAAQTPVSAAATPTPAPTATPAAGLPAPEQSKASDASTNKGKITKTKFEQVENGMKLAQVREIIGSDGELMAEAGKKGDAVYVTVYMWDGDGGGNASFSFQNDELVTKSQVGLK